MAKNGKAKRPQVQRKGIQTFVYPRAAAYELFEKAASKEKGTDGKKIRLGQWLQLAALEKIAQGKPLNRKVIKPLIPADDFEELQRQRGMSLA